MQKKTLLLLILATHLTIYANNSFTVMTFNLNNFFDTYDDPNKDDKAYLPITLKDSKEHIDACNLIKVYTWRNECLYLDWSIENKNKKLTNIISTITSLEVTPDIIAFQEIENINALKDIYNALKKYGYKDYVLIEGNDYRGIDNAYISKYEILKSEQHKIQFSPQFATKDTRPILEIAVNINNEVVHLYNVHFPAPYHPIGMRKDAFNTLEKLVSSHANPAIALGDFNVSIKETNENKTYEKLDKNWDISHITGCQECEGTHFYRRDKTWSFLDVIILKEGRGVSFDPNSITTVKLNVNTNEKGEPLTFKMDTGSGVSDHLPVFAKILLN